MFARFDGRYMYTVKEGNFHTKLKLASYSQPHIRHIRHIEIESEHKKCSSKLKSIAMDFNYRTDASYVQVTFYKKNEVYSYFQS